VEEYVSCVLVGIGVCSAFKKEAEYLDAFATLQREADFLEMDICTSIDKHPCNSRVLSANSDK
jgi:uncharacterized SAM-dependent methyltransferase